MEIREHNGISDKQLRQPFYYARWFCCMNKSCKTRQVMPPRYKVMNPVELSERSPDKIKQTVMQPEPADPGRHGSDLHAHNRHRTQRPTRA